MSTHFRSLGCCALFTVGTVSDVPQATGTSLITYLFRLVIHTCIEAGSGDSACKTWICMYGTYHRQEHVLLYCFIGFDWLKNHRVVILDMSDQK